MVAATMSIELDPDTAEAVAEASPEERKQWALLLRLRLRELTSLSPNSCRPERTVDVASLPEQLQTVCLPADTDADELHWEDLEYGSVPLKRAGQVTIRVTQRGSLKPMVHALEDE